MRALTFAPGVAASARLDDLAEPAAAEVDLLVEVMAVGVCGTDHELLAGVHGEAAPGRDRLVIGHESVARVLDAPDGSGHAVGDLVAGIVRRPDPVPCPSCAIGEWDMCTNGRYTERGIKARDGYLAERVSLEPWFAVPIPARLGELGVLTEPASIVAKAWEHIERIGTRGVFVPRRVLVTGAGPIGLLAALLGVQRGLDVHVLDRVTTGPKPDLVRELGATYHTGDVADACREADVVVECTGAAQLVFETMAHTRANGIVCLTGVTSPGRDLEVPAGEIARELVLENDVVFGSVNANRRHYEQAVTSLAAADEAWLSRLITRRVPLDDWGAAYERLDGDVKTVVTPAG